MKKLMLILTMSASWVMFGAQQDCGLNNLFENLRNDINLKTESHSTEGINQSLQDFTKQFGKILDTCTPSKESIEPIVHNIARVGTPKMLDKVTQTKHFNGFDNVDEKVGGTPLMSASYYGNIDLVEALLEKGANPSTEITREVNGIQKVMTPLTAAFELRKAYNSGPFVADRVRPIIASRAIRYRNYPYDKVLVQRPQDFVALAASFHVCEQLIRAAQESPK